ncbi:MAG: SMC-Scp complex subunit ScpB [Promethearchaeota archaeon Loki_b32]|nr:MAG: SMC-Scp complex subunit ScpB [Candidatus Lokiarchaeota archaeon Loki_b32]
MFNVFGENMEENTDEEIEEEIEDISEDLPEEEEIERIDEEEVEHFTEEEPIKEVEKIDSNDLTKKDKGEIIGEQEEDSEEKESLEILEELGQEPESLLIEELLEEQNVEDRPNMVETTSESIDIDEKSLKLEVRAFHRNLIEAALYAAGGPLTIEELSTRLEFPKKEVENLVNELAFDYLERTTALIIAQIGDRYQMQIRPEYTEKVSKFAKGGAIAERYLRTLTIIALKQPILKSMVIKLRGSGAYEHVKYLIDYGFINALKKGRSHELTTTDKYADMFGLPKDIRQLKSVMITQLGLEEEGQGEPPVEIEEDSHSVPISEIEEEDLSEHMDENKEVEE